MERPATEPIAKPIAKPQCCTPAPPVRTEDPPPVIKEYALLPTLDEFLVFQWS
jgi:hypothetical protein